MARSFARTALLLASLGASVNSNATSLQGSKNTSPVTSSPPGTSASPSFPSTLTNPGSVVDFCFSLYQSFLNASGTPTIATETDTFSFPVIPSTGSDTTTSFFSTETTTFTFTTTLVPTPYTPPPQCFTGCVINVEQVLLHYWPTPKPNITASTTSPSASITSGPPLSTIVDGSTFVSPSNYIAFTSLIAEACPLGGSPCTTIGTPVALTTLAFGQHELVSEQCDLSFQTINYEDFNLPIPWSIVSRQPGCTLLGFTTHDPASPDFGYTLNPDILMPSELRTAVNPLWASCTFDEVAFDPPSALTPEQSLTAPAGGPQTTSATGPSSVPAEPQSTMSSPSATEPSSVPAAPQPTKSTPPVHIPAQPSSSADPIPPQSSIDSAPPQAPADPTTQAAGSPNPAPSSPAAGDPAAGSSVPSNVQQAAGASSATVDTSAPVDTGSAPVDMGSAPADTGSAPADTGSAPADIGSAPADTGSTPADTGSVNSLVPSGIATNSSIGALSTGASAPTTIPTIPAGTSRGVLSKEASRLVMASATVCTFFFLLTMV